MTSNNDAGPVFETRGGVTLPDGAETQAQLQYDPALSLVTVPDGVNAELGEAIGILQFPVVLAGQHAQSPLTGILGGCLQQAQYEFQRLGTDEWQRMRSIERLVAIEQAVTAINSEYRPALQTLTTWSLTRLLSEHEFIEMFATDYATEKSDLDPATIVDACERLKHAVQDNYANPTLAGILDGIAQTYSRRVASVITDLTLRPEFDNVDGLSADTDFAVERFESFSITERCQRLADTFEQMFSEPSEHDSVTIEQSLIEECEISVADTGDWGATAVPTQNMPWRVEHGESIGAVAPELVGYPTGIAWLLSKAFTEGAIGGVVYPRRAGDMSWLINPWADSAGDNTYRYTWSRAIVTDQALGCLFRQAKTGQPDPTSLGCPFDALSHGHCGQDECAHGAYLDSLRENWSELCTAVGAHYS